MMSIPRTRAAEAHADADLRVHFQALATAGRPKAAPGKPAASARRSTATPPEEPPQKNSGWVIPLLYALFALGCLLIAGVCYAIFFGSAL